MNVVVNGLMVNYQKSGSGSKTIVCLHGWGDGIETFNDLSKVLEKRYSLLRVDLPGFGGSQRPDSAWSLNDYADFVAAWLDKIDAKKPTAIMGHSFGGAVAIFGLGKKQLSAEKLILIAAAGVREPKSLRKKALWLGAKAGKAPLYLLPPSKARRVKTYLYGKAGSDLMFKPEMRQTFSKTVSQDVRSEAGSLNLPTLLVYGTADKETPARFGETLNKIIKDSKLEIIPGADHFLHQVHAQEIGLMIEEFLK